MVILPKTKRRQRRPCRRSMACKPKTAYTGFFHGVQYGPGLYQGYYAQRMVLDAMGLDVEFVKKWILHLTSEKCCGSFTTSLGFRKAMKPKIPKAFKTKILGVPDWVHVFAVKEVLTQNGDKKGLECFEKFVQDHDRRLWGITYGNAPVGMGAFNAQGLFGLAIATVGGGVVIAAPDGDVKLVGGLAVVVGAGITLKSIADGQQQMDDFKVQTVLKDLWSKMQNVPDAKELKELLNVVTKPSEDALEYIPTELWPEAWHE